MFTRSWLSLRNAVLLLGYLQVAIGIRDVNTQSFKPQAFAVVQPVEGKTKLAVDPQGLHILRQIRDPVSPVVVIGPYRSGKSFLLNQLLGIGCDDGFGVGHARATQTRGIWVWGTPQYVLTEDTGQSSSGRGKASRLALIFVDTEGFESTGKADAYDDRIFALSTLISSVLIYNLPETIRESDIEKLSFAVQLADGFYQQSSNGSAPVEAANMLWLIQRDFLKGKTVQQMLTEALQLVPNPNRDRDIEQVNNIRVSLKMIAKNSTAFGLTQPHLDRTSLCKMSDSQLDPLYIQQRQSLQELVKHLAKPKVISGEVLDGAGLARLIEQMVGALNARDIPTAGSILEHFNKDLVLRVEADYMKSMEEAKLPMEEEDFRKLHREALAKALRRFDRECFGSAGSPEMRVLRRMLEDGIKKEWEARKNTNSLESVRICERLESSCEDVLEREQRVTLPSTGRFTSRYERCLLAFERGCIGPGRPPQAERLEKAWRRESSRFRQDYNDKLFNGLVMVTLVDILIFRFLIKLAILETVGWIGFIFLQVYPKMYLAGGSMYDSTWWQGLVKVWEVVVYYPLLDQVLLLCLGGFAVYRFYQRYIAPRCGPRRRLAMPGKKNGSGDNLRDMNV